MPVHVRLSLIAPTGQPGSVGPPVTSRSAAVPVPVVTTTAGPTPAAIASVATVPAPGVFTASGVTVSTTGIWGAGFQNAGDVADSTLHDDDLVLTGADVAGIHLSSNGGNDWLPNNTGIAGTNDARIAAVRFSATTANRAYMFSTSQDGTGTDNHLWRGTYSTTTGTITQWTDICQVPSGTSAGNPGDNHPRQTGRKIIALDEANDTAYLGTVDGIYKVTLSTGDRTQIALAGQLVTGIELDPQNATTAFVTTDSGHGVHRITSIRTAPSVATFNPSYLSSAQGCRAVIESGATCVYVATGRQVSASDNANSVVRWNGTGWTTAGNWTDISGTGGTALNADETGAYNRWAGIDARRIGSNTLVLVTHSEDVNGATGTKIGWATYSGSNPAWTKITTATTNFTINDDAGPTWWLFDVNRSLMADKGSFDSVSPVIDPQDATRWFVFGRSGIWRTINSGVDWYPVVRGSAVTTSWGILADQSNAARVAVSDVDWHFLRSTDGFTTQPMTPNYPASTVGWNLVQGESGQVVLCMGSRDDNANGGCYRIDDPWISDEPDDWVNEVLTGTSQPWASVAATPRCTGAALWNNGTSDILLAAFQGGGIRRKVGLGTGGTWSTPTFSVTVSGTANQQRCHFAHNNGVVAWVLDPSTGVWQSSNSGNTWTQRQAFSFSGAFTGHLRRDIASPSGIYYFCRPGQLWKITSGNTTSPVLTQIGASAIALPAALAVHPTTAGKIAVCENASGTTLPKLWVSVDGGANWTNKTTPRWQAIAWNVKHMNWASDGTLYVALYSGYAKVTGL